MQAWDEAMDPPAVLRLMTPAYHQPRGLVWSSLHRSMGEVFTTLMVVWL